MTTPADPQAVEALRRAPMEVARLVREIIANLRQLPPSAWQPFLEGMVRDAQAARPQERYTPEEWQMRVLRMAEVARRRIRPRQAHAFLSLDDCLFLEAMGGELSGTAGLRLIERPTEYECQIIGMHLIQRMEQSPDSQAGQSCAAMLVAWRGRAEAWFGEETVQKWFGA